MGDPRGDFTEFVEEASPSLLRTAWLLTGQRDAAHDLVQAALVKTYVAWPRVRRPEALAYTRRVMVNHGTDTWRKTRRERLVDEVPEADVDSRRDGRLSVVEDRDEIVRLLARLPEQQRKIVVLRYYADLSELSVAETLGISVGAVKSAASRGLAALRSYAEEAATPPRAASADAEIVDLEDRRRRHA